MVEAAGGRFGREDGDVDFLVVVEKGAVGFRGVVDGILERGCRVGMVLCVCVGVDREEEIVSFSREMFYVCELLWSA